MSEHSINAEIRTDAGKGVARKLRKAGRVPGVFYHSGVDPVSLSVDKTDLSHLMHGPQGLVNLKLSDGKEELAVLKDYTMDPIRDDVTHVDFLGVKTGEEFQVTVPVHMEGEAIGVKQGGTIEQLIYELDISVLPSKMPENISIDVAHLDVGDSIQISDLSQEDFRILGEAERTVVHVIVTRTYEDEIAEMDAAAAEAEELEEGAVADADTDVEEVGDEEESQEDSENK